MNDVERALRDLGERVSGDVTYREVPATRIVRRVRLRRALFVSGMTVAVLAAAVVFPRIEWGTDGGPRPVAVGILESAAAATEDAGTARVELEMTMDFAGGGATTRATGVVDFENETSRMRAEISGPFGTSVADMITDGADVYQRVVEPPDSATEKWHRIDVPMPSGAATPLGASGADPADMLSVLRTISKEVVRVGDEELDGVPVTLYRATIDPSALGMDAAPEGVQFDLRPMDVWVDSSERVRKLTWAVTGEGTSLGMTLRLWDFGIPVEIEAPPPAAVTDTPLPDSPFGLGLTAESSSSDRRFMMVGEAGPSGPHVAVMSGEDTVLCILGMHPSTERATLVDERTGETVVTVEGEEISSSAGNPTGGGTCASADLRHAMVDRLSGDTEEFELRLERGSQPPEVIELATTMVPAD